MNRLRNRWLLLLTALPIFLFAYEGRTDSDILEQFSLALQKESEGDCLSAIFIYQDILKQNKYFLDAKIGLARCYFETGNLTLSEETLKDALKQEKKNVAALNLLGRVYTAMKRYAEAEEAFQRALSIKPAGFETKYRLADLYRAQGDYKRAIRLYNEILKVFPQEVKTYIYLGIAYTEIGELEKAGGFFRKAVSLDSHDPLTRLNLARHYYKMGVKLSHTENNASSEYFDAAISEANTALAIQNDHPEAYRILSSVSFYRKDFDAAIKAYDHLLELKKNDYLVYYELGYCYEMLGNLHAALDTYSKALVKRIDDEIIRFRLENILLDLYRRDLSNSTRIKHSDYHFSRGKFLLDRNLTDKAFLHFKRAIMLDPLNADKRIELAELMRTRQFYEQYLFELKNIIHETLDVDTVDIKDRIEIYTSRVEKNLGHRWHVNQYGEDEESSFPRTKTRIAVLDSFRSDYVNEDFLHRRISKSFKEILSLVLSYYQKIEVVSSDREIFSHREALREAQSLNADYYITGSIEEKIDSLKVRTQLVSGFNGQVKEEFFTFYTGNDKVFNTVVSLGADINERIPIRGMIVRMEGRRALINIGKAHGVEKDMVFHIIQEGSLRKNPETGEFVVDPDVSLGELTIKEVDEMIAEGEYTITGTYNRVNVYDHVVLREEGESDQ